MRRPSRTACASVLVGWTVAAGAAASPKDDLAGQAATTFSEAAGPVAPDRRMSLKSSSGGSVTLVSVRFTPAPALSQAVGTTWCGLTVVEHGAAQSLVAVGEGVTEAAACGGLVDAQMMPPASAGSPRLGLLYRTSSPNATGLTPVVLVQDRAAGRWSVDEEATEQVSEAAGAESLRKMRAVLSRR